MTSVYRPFDAVNMGRGNQTGRAYFSQRFNVCRECLKKALSLKPANQLEWIEGKRK